jgi:hypothetical protein
MPAVTAEIAASAACSGKTCVTRRRLTRPPPVALHTAAKYPAKVGRLVAASANIRPDAIYPEMRAQQRQVSAAAASS